MPNAASDPGDLLNATALLVIDAQDSFVDTLYDRNAFLERCAFALDAAQALGLRTLFTEQVPEKLGGTNERLLRRAKNPKVFRKSSFSALSAPGIANYLREKEIYHLLVCGLETPICIYQTGLQAAGEDFDITFLTDALGCRRQVDESHALRALADLGCQLLPSETVFYSILGEATHPRFREFSKLVSAFSSREFSVDDHLNSIPVFPKNKQEEPKPKRERRPKRKRAVKSGETSISDDAPSSAAKQTTAPKKRVSKKRGRKSSAKKATAKKTAINAKKQSATKPKKRS